MGIKSSDAKKKIIRGLKMIVVTLQSVYKADIIKDGYKNTGQYPLDFRKAMSKCTTALTAEQLATLESKLPAVVELFREHGRVTEEQMDQLGVISVDLSGDRRTMPKDCRALHQQRAVIMNADAVTAQYRSRMQQKAVAENAKRARAANKGNNGQKRGRKRKAADVGFQDNTPAAPRANDSPFVPVEAV